MIFGTTGIPGRPDFEATIPASFGLESEGTMPFDNTNGYTTGVAILNPSSRVEFFTYFLVDENGTELKSEVVRMEPYSKLVFAIPERWPESRNRRGALRLIDDSANPLAVVGLRFHPSGAFTTIFLLEP